MSINLSHISFVSEEKMSSTDTANLKELLNSRREETRELVKRIQVKVLHDKVNKDVKDSLTKKEVPTAV